MWENNYRKEIIKNIFILAALALAGIGLMLTMKKVNQRIAAEDAILSQQHASQRQELNDARKESIELVKQEYRKDLDTLAKYLPGIVCWGDSLTTGSSGNVSYPQTLQKYIDTYLTGIYDLRYSLENVESYGRINWEEYKISIPVVNMGSGQENTDTILGRSGVSPYVVNKPFVIPAGTESVSLTFTAPDGRTVTPLLAGNAGVNPVTIAGVEGTLTRVPARTGVYYEFTRSEAGAETPVEPGTEILTAVRDEYRDYFHIVWLGTYSEFTKAEDLVNDTKKLLERQNINPDRFLVIGPCTYGGAWVNQTSYNLEAIDSVMMQAFGNRYINLRKYLVEDGFRDAGLSASSQDTGMMAFGFVPYSFRSNAGGADLKGIVYELLGGLIYERMELLGYFDEIRSELGLDKITEEILNTDPSYFETRLNG